MENSGSAKMKRSDEGDLVKRLENLGSTHDVWADFATVLHTNPAHPHHRVCPPRFTRGKQ